MMKFIFVCVAVMCVMGNAISDEIEKFTFDALPKPVQETLISLGATKYLSIEKETFEEAVEYVVRAHVGESIKELALSSDGKILELEATEWGKEMEYADLPSAVRNSFSLLRSDDIEEVCKVTLGGVVTYMIFFEDKEVGKEATFLENGKLVYVLEIDGDFDVNSECVDGDYCS